MTSKLYAVLSWALVLLGAVHVASTFRIYPAITMPALWFLSGGLLIALGAMLNLLNRAYGHGAPGLRVATVAVNVVVGGVAAAGGLLSRASVGQLVVVLSLYVGLTALSCTRGALRPTSQAAAG